MQLFPKNKLFSADELWALEDQKSLKNRKKLYTLSTFLRLVVNSFLESTSSDQMISFSHFLTSAPVIFFSLKISRRYYNPDTPQQHNSCNFYFPFYIQNLTILPLKFSQIQTSNNPLVIALLMAIYYSLIMQKRTKKQIGGKSFWLLETHSFLFLLQPAKPVHFWSTWISYKLTKENNG